MENVCRKTKKHTSYGIDRMSVPAKIILYGILTIFELGCLIPFLMLISSSLATEDYIMANGYPVLPAMLNFDAYGFIGVYLDRILIGYKVSILATLGGTLLNVFVSVMLAYPLSNMNFRYRSVVSFFVFFTMMFGGGLIPTYILIK
ncbi:MAG: carbohydrate ABC transporter permease, partial [Christensenellales bacterium]